MRQWLSRVVVSVLLVSGAAAEPRGRTLQKGAAVAWGENYMPLRELQCDAPGYPNRSSEFDVLPGFQTPPPGYGQVPFWWWSGDDLDEDRLLWQLRQLHEKGISGVQVNYSHTDEKGWPTDPQEPALFADEWWQIYSRVSEECGKLGMGIGLSTYTLDWPNGATNLFFNLFYSRPELNALELTAGSRQRIKGGQAKFIPCVDNQFAVRAYEVRDGILQPGGIDLTPSVHDGILTWTAPAGEWEVWTFGAARREGSLNPLLPGAGQSVVKGFFQEFQNHNPGKSSNGLNFFFNDELEVGVGKYAWNPDFAEAFQRRKGYDLMEVLPALWTDMGDVTPKVRIDYADVRMSLMEERYFKPIHNWHAERGIIFGCDNHGRGLEPDAYGDYFRACRWYTAPGHDTPQGHADVIKGKVSSSIANLYQRPRVWLEGYHSLGWGATPENLMFATRENYLYGCTLLNLHGLYYSTYGSRWEWAPPCYHFRMPYWEHMDVFLKYFERLSYLMSQGHHVCDVAVIYPVTPYEAQVDGQASTDTAFEIARELMAAGIDFEFIDHQSLARAEVGNGQLLVKSAQASYRVLIVPNMEAVRWKTLEKAAAFSSGGGLVLSVGALPSVTDRAGANDSEIRLLNKTAFRKNCRLATAGDAVERIQKKGAPDVRGLQRTVRALHRKIGPRDVYLVMDAEPGDIVEFRAKGKAELWDPWTGDVWPLRVVKETSTTTKAELPLQSYEAQVVVFTPGARQPAVPARARKKQVAQIRPEAWRVQFIPTMDNRHGDFRLPVTPANRMIGVEARQFRWARETEIHAAAAMRPELDDSEWETQLHGFGPQFYQLGPVPETVDSRELDKKLAGLRTVDPAVPVEIGGESYVWKPYSMSWRFGKEGDPGHQGFHGLKGALSDHFIRLGKISQRQGVGVAMLAPEEHCRYYLWTSAMVAEPVSAAIHVSTAAAAAQANTTKVTAPAAIYINGEGIEHPDQPVDLKAGSNPVLLRYDDWSQSYFVLRRPDVPVPDKKHVLSMRWYNDPGVIPFDVFAGEQSAEWFRFLSAPGTAAIQFQQPPEGRVEAWISGEPMIDKGNGRYEAQHAAPQASVIALRLEPKAGQNGGAAVPEPISVETTGAGVMSLGDWSKMGILNNYSGGVRYSTVFTLTEADAGRITDLDLGRVTATAEVYLNGKKAGVRVAPPWQVDVTGFLKAGENSLDIIVYNTLANHYQTIPSLYRGDPLSGLLGPVKFMGE